MIQNFSIKNFKSLFIEKPITLTEKLNVFIGVNGAGKSTFLRIASGIYKPTSGKVAYDGINVFNNTDVKSKILFVPDELYFLPGSNMKSMASLYASCYKSFDKKRFAELSELFGLNINKRIGTFSKGMKRQAAIILALSSMPQYVFFDECFDGLDPIVRNHIKKVLYNDVLERGTTVIITSHSLRELEDTCDQLALLHKGGLVLESDVQKLQTSFHKIQIALVTEFDRSVFDFMNDNIVNYSQTGKVAHIIVNTDTEKLMPKLNELSPALLDVIPLSLEEVFVYEMEALGYAFDEPEKGASK